MSELSSLIPALSALLERAGTSPIKLEVALCDAQELQEYKTKVEELEARVASLTERCIRAEFLYGNELHINNELTDFCRAHGLDPPKNLFRTSSGQS